MSASPPIRFAPVPSLAIALLIASVLASCSGATAAGPSSSSAASNVVEGAPGPTPNWTTFQDPFEKAFTVEVPQGWAVRGGLFRMGYSDFRPMVDLTSPDGRINVRIGDISIPTYSVPSQGHYREGEVVDLGAQAQLVVARYRQGPEFAVHYFHVRFYQSCHDPVADSANVDFTVPDYLPKMTDTTQSSTGSISYKCADGAGQKIAFAYVRTSAQNGLWEAQTLASFIAPADRVVLARTVLEHSARSFHINPEWVSYQTRQNALGLQYQQARQRGRMADLARQVQQFDAQMAAMRNQVASFERHQAAQSSQVEGFTQALRGVTPTLDPMTGESREVWTGPNGAYWTNSTGAVVNASGSPGTGWHQLQVTGP